MATLAAGSGAELALDLSCNGAGQIGVVAVEVLRGVQVKAPHGFVVHPLRQADRIGHRHQDDLADHVALPLGRFQQGAQVMGDQHAGQFFGVQAGLDVGLSAHAPGVPK